MDLLKKIFPFSFGEKKDVASLVITVIIHVAAAVIIGLLLSIRIPIFGISFIISITGAAVDFYLTIGVVLTFLHYFKVLKD